MMASKNLQAIAVNGTRPVPIRQPEPFRELQTAIRKKARGVEKLAMFGKYGTPRNQLIVNERGLFPTRNYQAGMFEGIQEVSHVRQQERFQGQRAGSDRLESWALVFSGEGAGKIPPALSGGNKPDLRGKRQPADASGGVSAALGPRLRRSQGFFKTLT